MLRMRSAVVGPRARGVMTGGYEGRMMRIQDGPRQGGPMRGLQMRGGAALLAAALLAGACAAPAPSGINDPHEDANRRMHEFNRAVDLAVVRPLSGALSDGGEPGPLGTGLRNAARNLSMPAAVMNKTLQLRFEDAVHNTVRFALNTTIGLGGLFDPAGAIGLTARKTDFGETLHVWGLPEGNYLELPLLGPSTDRDLLGTVLDAVADPLGALLPSPERHWARAARIGSKLGDRARFSGTVDSILHESADSYAQARLMYLQKRRFELGQEPADDDFFDPYDEFAAD